MEERRYVGQGHREYDDEEQEADAPDDQVHFHVLFAHVALCRPGRLVEGLGLVGQGSALILEDLGLVDVGQHHLHVFLPAQRASAHA